VPRLRGPASPGPAPGPGPRPAATGVIAPLAGMPGAV